MNVSETTQGRRPEPIEIPQAPVDVADMQEFEAEFPTVCVVVPTRNEALNLPYVAERMPPVDEIVVVDGGSVDGTVEVAGCGLRRGSWNRPAAVRATRWPAGSKRFSPTSLS